MKLMFLALFIAIAAVMARPFLPEDTPPPAPLRVNVAPLGVGGVQGLEWNRQRLLIVRIAAGGHFLVAADYDPFYGCPLNWIPAGSTAAPRQPWPGGLRAICTEHWFDSSGASLTEGVADLKRFPYALHDETLLIVNEPQ